MLSAKHRLIRLLALAVILFPCTATARTIYDRQNPQGHIILTETDGLVCLITEDQKYQYIQGCVHEQNPLIMASEHNRALMSALMFKPQPERVLIIGMGVGALPMAIRLAAPGAFIETVEQNPEVYKICRELFYYRDEDELTKTYLADGREFVKQAAEAQAKYDIVIINILTAEYIPDHMMTKEFLEMVQSIMNPGAIIAVNTLANSRLYDSESVTYSAVFGKLYNYHTDSGHRIIVAANQRMPDVKTIQAGAIKMARLFLLTLGISVNDLLPRLDDAIDWQQSAQIISDDNTPSDILDGPFKATIKKYRFVVIVLAAALILMAVYALIKTFDVIAVQKSTTTLKEKGE